MSLIVLSNPKKYIELIAQLYKSVMQLLSGTIQPKKGHQTDKYQGGLNTTSKLRHGKGTYAFDNTFFTFQGNYENGKKQGPGTLIFKDGRIINAQFGNDQMIGHAEIIYPDGSKYVGNLQHGQKDGEGSYTSLFESYEGEWKDNCRHGKGSYKNHSTNEEYQGEFNNNKPHGVGHLSKWNFEYTGSFEQGLKNGEGRQVSDWCREEGVANSLGRYEYQGGFKCDKFEGKGCFKSRQSKYVYEGEFTAGQPNLYPNEFRCFLSTNTRNAQEIQQGDRTVLLSQPIEYQLQGDSFNLYIETVYQGPQALDQIQPTQQQIDTLIKNWQNDNKKNKNPPPMPDFNQPRMKKPEMILVEQQSGRCIEVRLIKQVEGKEECLKIDYRAEILAKRKENQELRQQALKKAEEEGNKKGGKKDNKGQPQLKVNLFKEHPTAKEKVLQLLTEKAKSHISRLEFPDDFPPGKYYLQIRSPFSDFGELKPIKKELNIKPKIVKKK